MGQFLRSLIEADKVPFYADYRTGSVRSLSGLAAAAAPTASGTPRLGKVQATAAIFSSGGRLVYGNQSDQILTSATFFISLDWSQVDASVTQRIVCKRDAIGECYDLYLGTNLIYRANGTTSSFTTFPRRVACISHSNGTAPKYYPDGTYNADGNSSSMGSYGADLTIGSFYTGIQPLLAPMYFVLIVNEAIPSAEISRLYRELVAGPSVVSRPRKGFSLPYPAKTPAEYAAEGIIWDSDMSVSQGETPDFTANGRIGDVRGPWDVVKDGPFGTCIECQTDESSKIVLPAPDVDVFRTPSWCFQAWFKPDSGVYHFLFGGTTNNNILAYTNISDNIYRIRTRNSGGGLVEHTTGAGGWVSGKWHHLSVHWYVSGSDQFFRVYVDGTPFSSETKVGVGVSYPSLVTWAIGTYNNLTQWYLDGRITGVKYLTSLPTPEETRNEYLLGARKCLLDARVHEDGSCPVSLAAVGAGNEIANGWKIESGTWRVVDDVPGGGSARAIECVSAGQFYQESSSAYGSWYMKVYLYSNNNNYIFCSSTTDVATTSGYEILYSGGTIYLYRLTAGAGTGISSVSLANGVYELWVARRFDGLFNVWVKGGSYSDWTLLFTATDSTHTTSKYFTVRHAVAQEALFSAQSFLGEMTPYEAIRAGILEGEIPEPFWTVTTTDTSQTWTIIATTGSVYVFDWGDGEQTWHTGVGSTQTVTHTYTSAGTYTIRLYVSEAYLSRLYSSGNALSGADVFPVNGSALVQLRVHLNNFTGTTPSISAMSSLVTLLYNDNNVSGYTPSIIAVPLTTFNASGNALTVTAVDQILADFATNVAARPAVGTINLSGGTNAAPSAAGLASKAAILAAKPGWTILHN